MRWQLTTKCLFTTHFSNVSSPRNPLRKYTNEWGVFGRGLEGGVTGEDVPPISIILINTLLIGGH